MSQGFLNMTLIYPHFKACDLLLAAGQLPALHCTHSVQHTENITENSRQCPSGVHYSWPLENFPYVVLFTSFCFPGKVEKSGQSLRLKSPLPWHLLSLVTRARFFSLKIWSIHNSVTQVQVASAFFSPSHVAKSPALSIVVTWDTSMENTASESRISNIYA